MFVFAFSLFLKGFLCAISLVLIGVTAEKIRWLLSNNKCTCRVDLNGKIVIVTGGNSGIGFETAKVLAKLGARVIIASRNAAKSQAAVQEIFETTGNPNIEYKPLDLGKLSSIKQFADDFNKSYDRLDVLINNSEMIQRQQSFTGDGIDSLTQINHVGPTYLTKLLLNKLIASKPSRIIFVSSIAHKHHNFDPEDVKGFRHFCSYTRYANTKLANILVARALSKILPEGVTANSLHPGTVVTSICDFVPATVRRPIELLFKCFSKSVKECAHTSLHLAMAPGLARVSGEYFDECRIVKAHKVVTDELAERVWENTMSLIEEKTKNV